MAAWSEYKDCCRRLADRDREAVFCPECGHRLFRCPARDCRSLVEPLKHCGRCLDLRLSLEKGAVLTARVGECLTVPFVLTNNSPVRLVSIRSVTRDATNLPQEAVPLTWEDLDAGRTRAFAVGTGPFVNSGVNNLRLTLIVAVALDEVEEIYAFAGDVSIDVEGHDPTQVVQNFNLSGADFGTAGMVVANPYTASARERARQADALANRVAIALERAERYEIQNGHRGYEAQAVRIPRDVQFVYAGFPCGDSPPDGALLDRATIRCGRNGRARDDRRNAEPNDLCLRIYDPASGNLDRDASAAISRHVCDFVLQNDRLNVRTASTNLSLNGDHLDAGASRIVNHGDSFLVTAARERTLTFNVTFKVSSGLVSQVRFQKL